MATSWSPAPNTTTAAPTIATDVLILSGTEISYAASLREKYRVIVVPTAEGALQHLRQTAPSLVVAELDGDHRPAIEVCRQAKQLPVPSTVLVTTANVELVPDALHAGCDGVLLKPFQPNLLHARIGRLLRARSAALRLRAQRQYAKSEHLRDRTELLLMSGTNRHWNTAACPYCANAGVTSFEYASHRRAWFACLTCKKVWMAKRQE
jgi:DNA-binding NarL/FixJ family response regulator